MGNTVIEFNNVSKSYKNLSNVLFNINLSINQGEIFGILGYSGAGKSTLIRLINGLEVPNTGSVLVNNVNINAISYNQLLKLRKKIGMIFQGFNLFNNRSVFNNIAFPLEIAGFNKEQIKLRVMELLYMVGLIDKVNFYPKQLSGGEKQRVGIARALANNPDILLCDEATSALDAHNTASILQLIKDIQQNKKLTVVLITHEVEVVKAICNKIAVINKGSIIETGYLQDIVVNPQQFITKQLLETSYKVNY